MKKSPVTEIALNLQAILELATSDVPMTVPFEHGEKSLYLIHREEELIPGIVDGGFAILNKRELTCEFFPEIPTLAAHLAAVLSPEDLDLFRERLYNVLDLYLVYSVGMAKYAEVLIDEPNRTQEVYDRRMRVQEYFSKNRERLGLTTEFLAKTFESPDKLAEDAPKLELVGVEEDE